MSKVSKATAADRTVIPGMTDSVEAELETSLLQIPNLPDERVPPGAEGEFEVVRAGGEPRPATPEHAPHWEIGERLKVLDLERGSKVAGSGFPVQFPPEKSMLVFWFRGR